MRNDLSTPQPVSDIVALSAARLSTAIAAGDVSCRQVMQAYLAHIDACNPRVNAVVSRVEEDVLLAQADDRDAELATGRRRGWLHGLPIAIKDLSPTAGIRTTMGSPLMRDWVPDDDDLMTARLKAAGAIVVGKTNTPEFGLGSQTYNPVFGVTRNAFDPTLCAGGSSGGAAVALALRMLPVADGSDMMGSLRNPAAYNHVFGLRPTPGRVPGLPAPDVFTPALGTQGPMARGAIDLACLLEIQSGPDPRMPSSLPADDLVGGLHHLLEGRHAAGARIAWIGDWRGRLPMEDGVLDVCERALAVFADLGGHIESEVPDFDLDRLWRAWCALRQASVAARLRVYHDDPGRRARLKPEACWEIERGQALSALATQDANAVRSAWHQTLCALFERFDYLALPSAQVFAFDAAIHWPARIGDTAMDTYHRWMEVVVPGSMSAGPALSLPAGFDARGRAMGLQLIAPPKHEPELLALAHAYEQAVPQLMARRP